MPNSKNRRGDLSRRGSLPVKASSFHGRPTNAMEEPKGEGLMRRPRTLPDLRALAVTVQMQEEKPRLTKLLLNVTIQGSVGPVQVIVTLDSSVQDLIGSAVRQYVKEGRRPMLRTADSSGFDLHYSQFSLERIGRDEKLRSLVSRNFFLCPRKPAVTETVAAPAPAPCCSKEAQKTGFSWLKLMDFSL